MSTESIEPPGASSSESISRIKVWDVPTRVFHWLLAVSFFGAWLARGSELWRDVHMMFGYTVAGLLCFRIFWGFAGSYYARFSSFGCSPGAVLAYFKSLFGNAPQHFVGHSPAGALGALLLIGLGFITVGCGMTMVRVDDGEWLADLHALAAKTLLVMVVVHLLGVLVSSFLHRENLVLPMITGRKTGQRIDRIGRPRLGVGVALVIVVLGYWGLDRSGLIENVAGTKVDLTSPRLDASGAVLTPK